MAIAERRVSGAREYVSVLAGLAVGAVGCIVLAGTTWADVQLRGTLDTTDVQVTGSELVPVAEAAGWLGLAAVVAIHAARGAGRAVVGALLAVVGLAVAGWAGWRAVDLEAATETAATGEAVVTLVGTAPAAAIGTAVAGAVVAAAGALTVGHGSRWPAMGRKYERRDRAGETPQEVDTATAREASTSARDAWDAFDLGDDPTTWLRDPERTGQNETDATN